MGIASTSVTDQRTGKWPGTSLNHFLSRLIWFCICPLLLLAAYLAADHVRSIQVERNVAAQNLASNFVTALDQNLNARINGLKMLALSPLVDQQGQRNGLYAEARRFQQTFGSHVILADLDGQMLFNTRVPFDAPLPKLPRPAGHSAVAVALETGRPAVGDTFQGPVANQPLVAIVVPILREGKPAFLLLTTLEAQQFQTRFEQMAIPPGWDLTLLDGKGDIIAQRRPPNLDTSGAQDVPARFVVASTASPWSVRVEIPVAIYRASWVTAGATLVLALVGATLISFWGGKLASNSLRKSVASLVPTQGVAAPVQQIHEIESVRQLLAQFSDTREAALDALRESEERLQLFISHAPAAIAMFDTEMRYLAVSQRWLSTYSLGQRSIIGSSHYAVFPEIGENWKAIHRRAMGGEVIRADEDPFERADGRVQWLCWEVRPWYNGDGGIGGIAVFSEDITERRQYETDLRIAAAAFESREGMLVTDANSVILRVNRAFTEITGYTSEEAVGQTPRLLQSGRHDDDFYQAMWAAIEHTGGWQGEVWDRRKSGEEYQKWLNISAVRDDTGAVTHYVGTQYDITERKKAEETIRELAFFDPLTHLPNRTLLQDRLKQAMTSGNRHGSHGAVLFIDLDHFKTLNDTLGHDIGDALLQQVAQRLVASIREGDTVARLGGDEFVVVLKNLNPDMHDAATETELVVSKILHALNEKYLLGNTDYRATASVGATLFLGDETSIDDLLKQADLAMYKAKSSGRNTLRFFDPAMQSVVMKRAAMEKDLHEGIQEQQFSLYYQAQMTQGQLTGSEALVRWQHPQRGMVSPADFIPLAEETGLILPLGLWVLETACRQLARWAKRPDMSHLTLAVNVSSLQFRQSGFVQQVLTVLEATGANPARLKLELTESLLVDNVQGVVDTMSALKARGIGFSLDDFGTGYSSLSYLKLLPLDQLKIDQTFVRDVMVDPNDAAIARTIVALAHSLGLGVIAEGVETQAQWDFLAASGCHAYQGYLFSRPLPLQDFESFAVSPGLL